MTILVFFADLWKMIVQLFSLFSGVELLVIFVSVAFVAFYFYFLADWGMNPGKYKKRCNH